MTIPGYVYDWGHIKYIPIKDILKEIKIYLNIDAQFLIANNTSLFQKKYTLFIFLNSSLYKTRAKLLKMCTIKQKVKSHKTEIIKHAKKINKYNNKKIIFNENQIKLIMNPVLTIYQKSILLNTSHARISKEIKKLKKQNKLAPIKNTRTNIFNKKQILILKSKKYCVKEKAYLVGISQTSVYTFLKNPSKYEYWTKLHYG